MYYLMHHRDNCGFKYCTLCKAPLSFDKSVGDIFYDSWDIEMEVIKVEEFECHTPAVQAMLRSFSAYKKYNLKLDPSFLPRSKRK